MLLIGVLSGVAAGSTVFFRAAENRLLLATPVPVRALFLLRSLETGFLTSWAFGLLAAPALVALGVSYHRRAGFYAAAGVLLLAFLVFGGALGALLAVVLGRLLGRARSGRGVLGLTLAGLLLTGWLLGRSVVPTRAELLMLFEPGTLDGTTVALHFVEEKFGRWPSHPFAAALFGLATGQGRRPVRAFAASLLLPFGAAALAAWGGGALFRQALWAAAEGVLVARPDRAGVAPRGVARFPVLLREPVGALVEKEVLTFARTP